MIAQSRKPRIPHAPRVSSVICDPARATVGPKLCPIVLACDDAYGMPLATTLRSVLDSNPRAWPIECYVLSDGISQTTQRKVVASLPKDAIVIHWVSAELSEFAQFSTLRHISKITYARFLITELLPEHISKVLYLDADLLVIGDLQALCRTDLKNAPVGAVVDSFLDTATKQNRPGYEAVPRVDKYFNAGVLLIDLNRWRECQVSRRAMEYLTKHSDSPYSDQDALNIACDRQWNELDVRWNFQDHRVKPISEFLAMKRIAVVHFVTNEKPWIAEKLNPNAPFYDSYRSRTLYARTLWDRTIDFCTVCFVQFKALLGRCTPLRLIWRHLK